MSNGNGFAPSRLVVVRRVLVELGQRGDGDQQRPPTTGVVSFVSPRRNSIGHGKTIDLLLFVDNCERDSPNIVEQTERMETSE